MTTLSRASIAFFPFFSACISSKVFFSATLCAAITASQSPDGPASIASWNIWRYCDIQNNVITRIVWIWCSIARIVSIFAFVAARTLDSALLRAAIKLASNAEQLYMYSFAMPSTSFHSFWIGGTFVGIGSFGRRTTIRFCFPRSNWRNYSLIICFVTFLNTCTASAPVVKPVFSFLFLYLLLSSYDHYL